MEENEKQVKINVPEGYEIDKENSTFECIKFKKKESRFSDYDGHHYMSGVFIGSESNLLKLGVDYNSLNLNTQNNKNVFVSREAANSALAFAQLTQIRKCESKRYGIKPGTGDTGVYSIFYDTDHTIQINCHHTACSRLETYLAFDTMTHANLFLEENRQLIREYFMMY